MTGSAPGERAGADPSAIARLRDAALPLGILLVLGITLRFIIAYVVLPGSGLGFDVGSFSAWAGNLAAEGPWKMYDRGFFLDYTPGYLYVLWVLGALAGLLGGPGAGPGDLLKLPPMLADLGLAVVVFLLVADLGGGRRRALLAAGLVLAVPVTWIDSAIWSQVDSVGTLVLLLAVWRLGRGDDVGGTLLTTIAAIIKPQFGILIPLAAVLIIRRSLAGRERGWWSDDPILWAIRAAGLLSIGVSIVPGLGDFGILVGLGGPLALLVLWWRDRGLGRGFGQLVSLGLLGLGTAVALSFPFGINLAQLTYRIGQTAAGYPWITVNAYNPWALLTRDGAGLAAGGSWLPDITTVENGPGIAILGIPAVLVGTGLLLAAIAGLAVILWRRPDRRTLVLALAVMSIAFFVLPTRVHERYMFPFFALGAVLAARNTRWLAVYLVLAVAATMNLVGVLGLYRESTTGLAPFWDLFGGTGLQVADAARSSQGILLAAILHVGGLLAATIFLLRPTRDEDELWAPDPPPVVSAAAPLASRTVAAAAASEPPSAPAAGALAVPGGAGDPAPAAGWLRRAWHDRSAALAGEEGGRLGRLDIWLLVVLVVSALSLRTFRLAEPYDMHFDEVYHARTATEFLQHWRYGEPHSIYEYTHPHMAKYAIAGGLVAWGNDRVEETSNLGVPVRDALTEARWDDEGLGDEDGNPAEPSTRGGERLYIATGEELRIYDLVSRALLGSHVLQGASALALDNPGRRLFIGTDSGAIFVLSTDHPTAGFRSPDGVDPPTPSAFATAAAPVSRLWSVGDGTTLIAALRDGSAASWEAAGAAGVLLASAQLPGLADAADAGTFPALLATPAAVTDRPAVAARLAEILGGAAADYEALLGSDAPQVTVASQIGDKRPALEGAMGDGTLEGLEIRDVPRIAIADPEGVAYLDPTAMRVTSRIGLEGGATGLAVVESADPRAIYVASGSALSTVTLPTNDNEATRIGTTVWMPGPVSRVTYNKGTGLVHVLGRTPDGAGWTVYVVEPRGNSVFADARLPFEPVAWSADVNEAYPSADRQQLFAFAADGAAAAVSIGQHAFAWRLPGVIAGSFMVGFLFLLARILFRRRTVGILVGVFALLDGMFFVQSRIAMNDAYLGLFMVAGVTVFAAIWTGAWRGRLALPLGLPVVGVLMGLALASKWVALYAIGALGVLILIRSALGRVVVILGLGVATGLLGWMAIYLPPEGATSGGNTIFLLVMMGLTILAAVLAILHPIAWTPDEVRIAVALPIVAGTAVGVGSLALGQASVGMSLALACFGVAGAAAVGFWVGGRLGIGPLAPLPTDDDPASILPPPADAPDGWLRPGLLAGAPVIFAAIALLAIPVAVYVLSYAPWVALGNRFTESFPAGNTGQTFAALTTSMYDYHNNLRATHAASSPWWAWPLNLKPVWFYQGQMAGNLSGAIYDGGNIALWWMAIPAMGFVAFQAFRRRSNALGLVAVMIACMWLAWSRIDRATFEYHYYSTLPFVLLALAYFVAEIWHGPSARTWLLARISAAVALLAPVILWLGKGPLCAVAGVERVRENSQACSAAAKISISPSAQVLGLILVLVFGGGLVVWLMLRLDSALRRRAPAAETERLRGSIIVAAVVSVLAFVAAFIFLPTAPLVEGTTIPGEIMALLLLLVLGPLAWIAATARNPRRFVIGFLASALLVFLVFYPNWSGLPLPDAVFNYYQGLMPTWIYDFQFAVNQNEPFPVLVRTWQPLAIAGVTLLVGALMAWVAWSWRITLAERAEDEATLALED